MCNAIAEAVVTGDIGPQGQQDTLFDLNEATATYDALKDRGVDAKMIWHSFSAPDEDAAIRNRSLHGLVRSLPQDENTETGPEFAYFRNWIDYEETRRRHTRRPTPSMSGPPAPSICPLTGTAAGRHTGDTWSEDDRHGTGWAADGRQSRSISIQPETFRMHRFREPGALDHCADDRAMDVVGAPL
ncbi:unnamed protein product, partial [Mesorhabditis spiculigera]